MMCLSVLINFKISNRFFFIYFQSKEKDKKKICLFLECTKINGENLVFKLNSFFISLHFGKKCYVTKFNLFRNHKCFLSNQTACGSAVKLNCNIFYLIFQNNISLLIKICLKSHIGQLSV